MCAGRVHPWSHGEGGHGDCWVRRWMHGAERQCEGLAFLLNKLQERRADTIVQGAGPERFSGQGD
jgi:hypothetical protein